MIRYLKYLNRLRLGHYPVFLEYQVDMRPRWNEPAGNPHLESVVAAGRSTYERNLRSLMEFEPVVRAITGSNVVPAVNWKNHFIPALDALSIMHAAVNAKSTFMEVGSGNSTIFARHALNYFKKPVKIVSIDPQPRVEVNTLCDEIIRKPLEDTELSVFDRLGPGDSLFIDNSHRSFMNSDVTVFMMDVLPRLKPGVLVGVHDVFLPHDYPESWSSRAYNEQYLLACYLLANPDYFDLQLANYWICRERMHEAPLKPVWDILGDDIRDRKASAFWMVKK